MSIYKRNFSQGSINKWGTEDSWISSLVGREQYKLSDELGVHVLHCICDMTNPVGPDICCNKTLIWLKWEYNVDLFTNRLTVQMYKDQHWNAQ